MKSSIRYRDTIFKPYAYAALTRTRPLRWLVAVRVLAWLACTPGCERHEGAVSLSADPSALVDPFPAPAEPAPEPPRGMVGVPPGVLLAGTPEGQLPRVADAEMVGEQVVMKRFFIDEFPYPNEAGAIPKTNVTQKQAEALCTEQKKRLCTELEWERACKGSQNWAYPYGETYRSAECGTGVFSIGMPPPMGILPGCHSDFGMRDTHGSVWQWTASSWGRGTSETLIALRGGNARTGDVVGRCAHGVGRNPDEKRPDVGFRCCAGERNSAEVVVHVVRGEGLRSIANDPIWIRALQEDPPEELKKRLSKGKSIRILQTSRWRPIGNEEFLVQAGCVNSNDHAECGVVISRPKGQKLEAIAFVSSGGWIPNIKQEGDPRNLWVYGGDAVSAFRRKISYAWGNVTLSGMERKEKKKEDPTQEHHEAEP